MTFNSSDATSLGQCVPQTDTTINMVDLGLKSGVKAMWQQNMFHDFIIQVEDWEFRVHKVVLAATSKYFWAMFSDGFIETTKDKFELKGRDPYIMSKLLEFVYTEDEAIIKGKEAEVLNCSMYLQMPLVSVFCVKKLLEGLNVDNCQSVLMTLMEYSFHKGVEKVKKFMKANWKKLMELWTPEDIPYEVLQVVLECWEKSEWEMFLFIENWISQDYENRKGHVNQLMNKIRFCLIGPKVINSIKKMSIFSDTEGPWHDLVEKAIEYHKLPINLRVLDESEQARIRNKPSPVCFTIGYHQERASTFIALDEENRWTKHKNKVSNVPLFKKTHRPRGIDVNNFYIMCSTYDADQKWCVFDPHTLTWSKIAGMAKPRRKFALVHHDEYLYVLGGQYVSDYRASCTEVQRYSFRTNTWHTYGHMPFSTTFSAACVLGDTIYLSGGGINNDSHESDKFISLDLSSESKTWKSKPACLEELYLHKMCVMRIKNEDVVVNISPRFEITYFSPARNQWFEFDVTAELPLEITDLYLLDDMVFTGQNSVFILNVDGVKCDEYGRPKPKEYGVCWEWRIPENKVKRLADFPLHVEPMGGPTLCPFGALLALPSNI